MRAFLFSVAVLTALALDGGRPAQAQWCAQYDDYTYTCGFQTFQQCLDTVRGVGGLCRRDHRADDRRSREGDRERDRQRRDRW